MTDQDELIDRLSKLGMSGYEAKAYLALVHASRPLNGYEVAKLSGVPRSTVYETLSKLVARGAAFEARSSADNTSYLPLPPNSLLSRLTSDFEDTVDVLRKELPRLASPKQAHLIHNITGRGALLERAQDIIRESRKDLLVSVWPEEFDELQPAVTEAEARGVDVTMLMFGEDTAEIGHTYRHRFSSPEFVLSYIGYRFFVVVGDSRQSVVGGFEASSGGGIYSDNPAFVLLATEYVRHDIAMQLMGSLFGKDIVGEYVQSHPEFVSLRSAGSHGSSIWAPENGDGRGSRRAATRKKAPAKQPAVTTEKAPRKRAARG